MKKWQKRSLAAVLAGLMAFSCAFFGMTAFAEVYQPADFEDSGWGETEDGPYEIAQLDTAEVAKKTYAYTGSRIDPKVIVKDVDGMEVDKVFYDVKGNRVTVGTATATITFSGWYKGTVKRTFKIVAAKTKAPTVKNASKGFSIYWKKVKGATSYQVWRKKAGSGYVKAATISDPNKLSYWDKISAADVNGAKYTYKIRAYRRTAEVAYSATKSCYKLAQPKTPTVTNSGTGKITVSWTKNDKATGYNVEYVTGKSVKVKGTAKTKKILTVTPGKTYKVYVRAYKTVGDLVYYSKYSPAKTITAA